MAPRKNAKKKPEAPKVDIGAEIFSALRELEKLKGIPAYFGYNYLVARIEKLIFRMEANSIAFMDILNQPVQK